MRMHTLNGVVDISGNNIHWKLIPIISLAILIAFSLPVIGQEDQEEIGSLDHSTTFYLAGSSDLVLSSSEASGTVSTPDFRLLSGGGSRVLGTWETDPATFPISLGGNTQIRIRAGGIGTSVSFSVVLLAGGEELGSGSSGEMDLLSSTSTFEINFNVPEVRIREGDAISLQLTFHAKISRGIAITLGEGTHFRILSGAISIETEVHDHGGNAHIMAHVSTPWGLQGISTAVLTTIADSGSMDHNPSSIDELEGRVVIEWEIAELPEGISVFRITVIDASDNSYVTEVDAYSSAHAHEHDQGGIQVSNSGILLLTVVILGVMGVGYLGGITPLSSFFDEKKMRYLLAFAGGVFISTALFHALPESIEMSGWWALLFVGLGFGTLYAIEHFVIDFLDRKFRKKGHVHQYEHTGVTLHLHDHHSKDHEILTDTDVDPKDQVCSHHMDNTSEAAFFGVGLHNLIEGIVITTLFMNPETQAIGLIVILATILHKAPCTFSIASLLKMAGNSPTQIRKKVLIVLGMTPLGAVLALLIFMRLDQIFVGLALAFSAGTFLEIGILDLVPESVKPKKGRWTAIGAIILGLVLLWLFSLVHVH